MKNRYDIPLYLLLLTFALTMVSCDASEDAADESPVVATLAYAVSQQTSRSTRMSSAVVQSDGNYRGLQDVVIIPFEKQGKIGGNDLPKAYGVNALELGSEKSGAWFYYHTNCSFAPGVASMLFYARAAGAISKAETGSMVHNLSSIARPSDIQFRLEPIAQSTSATDDALAIASLLTRVANTPGWSTTQEPRLQALYHNFINQGNVAALPIAGSAANAKAHLNALYQQVQATAYPAESASAALRESILTAIENLPDIVFDSDARTVSQLGGTTDDYPGNADLPDGAAVLLWTGSQFVPQTETNTLAAITGITRYAYPPELIYHANSRIRTSNLDNRETFYRTEETWNNVLSKYEYDNSVVSRNTKAVAIVEPIQYGVGCLQVKLNPTESSLHDADGVEVAMGDTHFPLTGLIIGSQHQLGFDLKPIDPTSEFDVRFIYDNHLRTNDNDYFYLAPGTSYDKTTETLVLETGDDEKVRIVAEFVNNSDRDFAGIDGIIYRGTKFYLTAEVEPKKAEEATYDYERRVFTQDRLTSMSMTVRSLEKAYNVLPDLLSPRLEIGIELETQWVASTPATVELE